jgi:hypothetical protein
MSICIAKRWSDKVIRLNRVCVRSRLLGALVGYIFLALLVAAPAEAMSDVGAQQTLFHSDWQHGIDPRFGVQANVGGLAVVPDPLKKYGTVLQAKIRRSEDFSKVANGVPRAELLFPEPVRFRQGQAYRVRWSTLLPIGAEFDAQQLVIITQINQGVWLGAPTVALALQENRYAISQHGGQHHENTSAGKWLCCADADVGKWVQWELLYRPQDNADGALTELRRDGHVVFSARNVPNAYPDVQNAYLKIGLYKPVWKKSSNTKEISVLYGPVTVSRN